MKKIIEFLLVSGLLTFSQGEGKPIFSPTYFQFNIEPESDVFLKNAEVMIESGWKLNFPVIDGIISSGEWREASYADISCGFGEPVYLYIMNDATHLYIGILNTSPDTYDSPEEVEIYFDENNDNNLDINGSEGNFWFGTPSGIFAPPGPGVFRSIFPECIGAPVIPIADGTYHATGLTSYQNSFEIKINLINSELDVLPEIQVEIDIYDVGGRKIATLYQGEVNQSLKGVWKFRKRVRRLEDGVYFYRVAIDGDVEVSKIVLLN